jgi:hypothetical protein
MRLSGNAKELAELKYIQRAQEISRSHYGNIKRHEQAMSPGGAMKGAIDQEHLAMARKISEAFADSYLELFLAEGQLPDPSELEEIKTEIQRIIEKHKGNDFWTPRPSTAEALLWMPQQVYSRFVTKVRQLQLERALKRPVQEGGQVNRITIGGNNYGAIQQGGEGNIQTLGTGIKNEIE